jgi:hypothetical protein
VRMIGHRQKLQKIFRNMICIIVHEMKFVLQPERRKILDLLTCDLTQKRKK